MKRHFKALIAMALALALSLAMPAFASAAAKKPAAPEIKGASAVYKKDAVGLKYTWKKVAKAKGYQVRYNLFWTEGSAESEYTKKSVKKNAATISFQDYGTVDFQVRAYKVVKGKRVYGEWSSLRLEAGQVDALIQQHEQAIVSRIGTPKITKVAKAKASDAVALKYSWKKVSGAKGYQIRYKLFADGDYVTKNVKQKKKPSAKIGFQDYEDIEFQVRAYVTEGGKRFYGEWATKALTRDEVAALLK